MGTVSNSLASSLVTTSGSNSSSSSSNYFMGASSYSKDFQAVIDRAVAIASLPINLLTAQQTALTTQSTDLKNLDTQFTKLQAAVQGIGTALGGSAFQSTISDTSAVSASIGDGAVEGDYTIDVTSIGAYAKSLTTQTWNSAPDPSGNPATYTLMAGGKSYSFTAADNSAATVASAINSQYSNLVQALAVNVGSADIPDWRISLKSARLGPMNLDIQGPPPGLQQQQSLVDGHATSQTAAAWNSALDHPGGKPATYNLTIGGKSYTLTPSDNNIQTVVNTINNSLYGSQVTAAVVNVAQGGDPADNRIQLTSRSTGAMNLDLERQPPGIQQQQALNNGFAVSRTAGTWDSTPDPLGNPTTYRLLVGSKTYSITPSDNHAQTVADAINTQYGSLVEAQVVTGPGGDSDQRIQLTGIHAGAMNLDLQKTASLQHTQVGGTLATYEVVNSGKTVSSNTRSVSVAPGVTLTLLGQSDGPVDVTVTRSTSALNTALSTFADTYNATVDLVAAQRGQSAGSLQGQSILSSLSRALSSISTYSSSGGAISGLNGLGLDLGKDGHFTYNAFGLMSADLSNSTGVTAFLGSAAGGGFLKAVTDALNNLEDPNNGLLKLSETDTQSRLTALGANISDRQAKVDQLRVHLQNQMAAADALIATMQQQYSYLTSMFQAQQTADQMYK
ncbi:MAG: flagellar filament capping protein FliD [Acidobacteriia bacterium]|nr:flagellar filament capping protein FliD [Terriglobia bacterium]